MTRAVEEVPRGVAASWPAACPLQQVVQHLAFHGVESICSLAVTFPAGGHEWCGPGSHVSLCGG